MACKRWCILVPVGLWMTVALGWARPTPSAQQILDRCARRYAHAPTLTADIEVSLGGSVMGTAMEFRCTEELALQRPNLIRLRVPMAGAPKLNLVAAISDGKTLYTEMMSLVALRTAAPASLHALGDILGQNAVSFTCPVFFAKSPVYDASFMMDGVAPRAACKDPKLVGDGEVDGHPCWIVEATVGEKNKERFWIDRETYLLRRIWSDWNPIQMPSSGEAEKPEPEPKTPFDARAAQVRQVIRPMGPFLSISATIHDQALGRPLPPETFRYVPDEAVRIVESKEDLSRVMMEAIFSPMAPRPPEPAEAGPFAPSELVGQEAPDFTLPLVGGGELTLSSLRGKVVFLDFFAEWCGPCQREIPELIDIHEKMGDRVAIVGILTSSQLDEAGMESYIREKKIPYPVVNAQAHQEDLSQAFGVEGLPTNVVIGADGIIYAHLVGYGGREPLDQAIQQGLSGELPPTPPAAAPGSG